MNRYEIVRAIGMVVSRILGGLGNQMFQYAAGRSLANRLNTTLKLDLSFFSKQSLRSYKLDRFNAQEIIATASECNKLRGKEGRLFKVFQKLSLKYPRPESYINETNYMQISESVMSAVKGDVYLNGYWQHEDYFKAIRSELLREFSPKLPLSAPAIDCMQSIKSCNAVSIHVRRGDYVTSSIGRSVHGSCTLDYYNNAIRYICANVNTPVFFVFSDDIEWCKNNLCSLNDRIIFVDNTRDEIDDLILMMRCRHNIIANSTFSWWAAWLNEYSNKIVVSPKVWVVSNSSLHIAPFEWVKL